MLTIQQVADVVAQENGGEAGAFDIDMKVLSSCGFIDAFKRKGWYRRIIRVGSIDGAEAYTCTAPWEMGARPFSAPSDSYLSWVIVGLRESWGIGDEELADYLIDKPGLSEAYRSTSQLRLYLRSIELPE